MKALEKRLGKQRWIVPVVFLLLAVINRYEVYMNAQHAPTVAVINGFVAALCFVTFILTLVAAGHSGSRGSRNGPGARRSIQAGSERSSR